MKICDIETPALILDRKILMKNVHTMNALLAPTSLKLRPHYKSHKCAALAHLQIENGAVGMTCAKLGEAIDLVDSGIEDVLIANQIVDNEKIVKVSYLAKKAKIAVCVDDVENIKALSKAATEAQSTIYCLVEYDIGMQRCGVLTYDEVLSLANLINLSEGLVFEGIQAYAGHISHIVDESERRSLTEENFRKIKGLIRYLEENGVTVKTVSGGSTGTAQIKAAEGLYNELQAGSYLFMDSTYSLLKTPFDNSLMLLATVVSSREGLVCVDAGVKTCGIDQGMPKPVDIETTEIVASEEHFQLHNPSKNLRVGDKIALIPAHCCSTVNLHDKIYLVEDGKVVDRIEVTARVCGR